MPSGLVLSKSAQMRAKKAQGMSVGDIARLFGVSYHQAYSACVVNAGAQDTAYKPSASMNVSIEEADFSSYTWDQLFALTESNAKDRTQKALRQAATEEADRRDPTGAWMDRAAKWAAIPKRAEKTSRGGPHFRG